MKIRTSIIYAVNGTTKIDVLVGTDTSVQCGPAGANVTFPFGDGRYEQSANAISEGQHSILSVNYPDCFKVTRQALETDIRP